MTSTQKIEYPIYISSGSTNRSTSLTVNIEDKNTSHIVHRTVIKQMADKRQGTASTKTRSEVRGGGRKPWKQKGSGRARAGSTRSPLWRGGGVTFGPKLRSYKKKLNRKEWRLSLATVLYHKRKNTIIAENLSEYFQTPKTSLFINILGALNIPQDQKILLIVDNVNSHNKNLYLSARNIFNLDIITTSNINILKILSADSIIISKEALTIIQEIYK
uniref:Large ribosomal subunit protein uL4c n=1 Tax=Bulboplastis apyrenoidosa TaxID=1070855 RepID=A0A1X9PVP8_9RHOD|nr:50S ribosomal protein L4 [Bulboplastis apyrenoidosa]ARO90783.1 50S ribosomal protein L4 [Bulboplastis apyrenoidosa]